MARKSQQHSSKHSRFIARIKRWLRAGWIFRWPIEKVLGLWGRKLFRSSTSAESSTEKLKPKLNLEQLEQRALPNESLMSTVMAPISLFAGIIAHQRSQAVEQQQQEAHPQVQATGQQKDLTDAVVEVSPNINPQTTATPEEENPPSDQEEILPNLEEELPQEEDLDRWFEQFDLSLEWEEDLTEEESEEDEPSRSDSEEADAEAGASSDGGGEASSNPNLSSGNQQATVPRPANSSTDPLTSCARNQSNSLFNANSPNDHF